jgi:hypothetical protein
MAPEIPVCIFAHDAELRAWLADELALMSPTIAVQIAEAVDDLAAGPAALCLLGTEALTAAEVERVCALVADSVSRVPFPVIAIGALPTPLVAATFACVLDAKLTSKQLERAVRDALAGRSA